MNAWQEPASNFVLQSRDRPKIGLFLGIFFTHGVVSPAGGPISVMHYLGRNRAETISQNRAISELNEYKSIIYVIYHRPFRAPDTYIKVS